ncbi:MAG: nitronate monooxygenase [Alphaproteobacteria bacterium]|nr:nitronate monooxygenase [Alphaproteobacteria bacterium]
MARLHTPICDLFGIELPIFAAGMGGVTLAPLAGAVSAAGGLGVMGLTFHTPEQVRAEIRAIRRITDRPFGVGFIIPTDIPADLRDRNIPPFPDFLADLLPRVAGLKGTPPPPLTLELARAQVAVALEERVPVLSAGIGTPDWLIEDAHKVGTKVISVIGAARHAARVSKAGTDCIVAQGMEAGGHVGQIPTAVLVPQVVDQVQAGGASVPVLAAGGIVDGRGIAAAFALGAQGVWIGTRFLATQEATAHQNHKDGIVAADETGTVVSRCYTGKPSRVLRNIVTERWKGRDAEILPMPWQRIRVEPLVAPAKEAGMVDLANFPTGQGAGAIKDIPSAAELVARLVDETVAALGRAAAVAAPQIAR